ncbi:23S rRNA (uracil(1939)-C(5))-methyltransferase RlmD [Candidatus Ichthyocystis sparus]|nr:23S rRNA (uracil(1939)-C(5))-methyltransferase RlmD [Candidatus Ichthyocystis sparus]
MNDEVLSVCIESIDNRGRGVGRLNGKTIFVDGAITSERALCVPIKKRKSYDEVLCKKLETASPYRQEPRCPYYGVCGGCSMQHMSSALQVSSKQRALEQTMLRIGNVRPRRISSPVYGLDWFYRNRASLSVRFVAKKGRVVVGFREKNGRYVTDMGSMGSCCVLAKPISDLLPLLPDLVHSLDAYKNVPVIEVAVGHDLLALLFRFMVPLSDHDHQILLDFSKEHGVQFWIQEKKSPDSAYLLDPNDSRDLFYRISDFNLDIRFLPYEFTQVNHVMNAVLVRLAMMYLDVCDTDRILDLFCGIGNFTLPIARLGAEVAGVEISECLVKKAIKNSELNGLSDLARFFAMDLYKTPLNEVFNLVGECDKILLDPPRSGAFSICQQLNYYKQPKRIVYVSCHPASLARDAGVLVHQNNYVLSEMMLLNMFPHTSHVEVLSIFDLDS